MHIACLYLPCHTERRMSKKEEREAAIIDVLADVGGEEVDPIPMHRHQRLRDLQQQRRHNVAGGLLDIQSLCS
jgi:hypothetical protein